MRALSGWAAATACLAALPQLWTYAGHVRRGDYPGSAYQPRVDAMLEVSRVAASGGPFAALGNPPRFGAVERFQADLGVPGVADVLGRLRGTPIGVRTLGTVNLIGLAGALLGLIAVLPGPYRLAIAPVLLFVPLSSPVYVSPDIPTIHGAFALLAVFVVAIVLRTRSYGPPIAAGLLLFVLQRFRSVYALYALATLLAVTAWSFALGRDRRALLRPLALVLTLAALSVPWSLFLRARAHDPRFAEDDALGTHNVFEPLLAGVGWTSNRWGLQPWDAKVNQFLADRLRLPPIPLYTREAERRSLVVYLSLWREAPAHLAGLYLARIPAGFHHHFFLGGAGAVLWALGTGAALVVGWRRRDVVPSGLVLAFAVMVLCLVAQCVVLDARLLYGYPLKVLSALSLAVSMTALVSFRRRLPEAAPQPDASVL